MIGSSMMSSLINIITYNFSLTAYLLMGYLKLSFEIGSYLCGDAETWGTEISFY